MSGTEVENATARRAVSDEARATEGGVAVPLTVVEPGRALRGGIVVLQEARGVTDDVERLATALADEGWLTVTPHLYHRAGEEADGDGALASLSGDTVLEDCDAAFAWLADRGIEPDRIGVIGFDLGGSVALVVAASRQVGAAVTVSGGGVHEPLSAGLPTLVETAPSLVCPWLGLYGEEDEAIPSVQVEALREAAMTSEVATNVVTYAGVGHRFDTEEANSEALHRVFLTGSTATCGDQCRRAGVPTTLDSGRGACCPLGNAVDSADGPARLGCGARALRPPSPAPAAGWGAGPAEAGHRVGGGDHSGRRCGSGAAGQRVTSAQMQRLGGRDAGQRAPGRFPRPAPARGGAVGPLGRAVGDADWHSAALHRPARPRWSGVRVPGRHRGPGRWVRPELAAHAV